MQQDKIYLPRAAQSAPYRLASLILSRLYGLLLAGRNIAYDWGVLPAKRLPGRVISVGNIAVGGTGKTPVVIALANYLKEQGARPAILTRGYKSSLGKDGSALLLKGRVAYLANAKVLGQADEAMLSSQQLPEVPIILGVRRHQAALHYLRALEKERPSALAPTHWIVDDGFQHRGLARDLDIVLLAADEPWGNGYLLPAGSLREPAAALQRADVLLVTRSPSDSLTTDRGLALGISEQVVKNTVMYAVPFVSTKPRLLSAAEGGKVEGQGGQGEPVVPPAPSLVVTGIARPQRLLNDLQTQGITIAEHLSVNDHHPIPRAQLLAKSAQVNSLITTTKDYWRDPAVFADLLAPVYLVDTSPTLPLQEIGRYLLENCSSFDLT